MNISKKRPFSLLEVTISLVLTTILLTTLFSSYRQLIQNKIEIEKASQGLHWRFFTQTRLNQIFESLEEGAKFETKEGALVFHFDNELDADPAYSGQLDGKLSLEGSQLCLFLKDRKEILHKNVKNLTLSFYDPKEKKWKESWKGNALPLLLKMRIDDEEFSFRFPKTRHEVNYS